MNLSFEKAYDLIFDREQFLAYLDEVAATIGARDFAAFWANDAVVDTMFAVSAPWSNEMLNRYYLEYTKEDPWFRARVEKGPSDGSFISMDRLVATEVFKRSRLRNELLIPEGEDLLYGIGNLVCIPTGEKVGVTFYRGEGQSCFTSEESDRLNTISSDLTRIILLQAQLHRHDLIMRDWRALVGAASFPVFVIDQNRLSLSLVIGN